MVKYLDNKGLTHFWGKVTSLFYKKEQVDALSTYKTAKSYSYSKSIEAFTGIIKGSCYVGTGTTVTDVYGVSGNKHDNFNTRNKINITCTDKYIFVVYPASSDYEFDLTMNGFSIPVNAVDTTSISGYVIIKSQNTYTGTFSIKL